MCGPPTSERGFSLAPSEARSGTGAGAGAPGADRPGAGEPSSNGSDAVGHGAVPTGRIIHLGLGAFHKAHQAWYTQRANELARSRNPAGEHESSLPLRQWEIHAFTGRSPDAALILAAQACRYTLIERGPVADSASIISSITEAHDGADLSAWRRAFADPRTAIVTLTITEAGYRSASGGGLDFDDPTVLQDIALLREAAPHDIAVPGDGPAGATTDVVDGAKTPVTAPARLVDGLRARMLASAGPIAVVSCDNVPDNGRVTREAVVALATRVDPELSAWIEQSVSFVSTMVDRITPATTDADRRTAEELTGFADRAPVVTEPFTEWVLSGAFPSGRPQWDLVGAQFVDDIAPYEQRKLWLLNAGHSLLAYRGLIAGHATIAQAFADPACRVEVEQLWSEARAVLALPSQQVDVWLAALRDRWRNARIEHRLVQVATDGSVKLPLRLMEVVRRRQLEGLPVGIAGAGLLAAWAVYLSRADLSEVEDSDRGAAPLIAELTARSSAEQARVVVDFLAPDLGDPEPLIDAVASEIDTLRPNTPSQPTPERAH
jgi:fructuronate reductase